MKMRGKITYFSKVALIVAATIFLHQNATATTTVDLGTASSFAVLAGSGITNTGPTTITGDVGTFPITSETGFGSVTLNGTNHGGDAVTQKAKNDLLNAYIDAATRPPNQTFTPAFDLSGLTLQPGVYRDPTSFGLTGTLTLDAHGNPNAVFIFQTGSTLITGSNSDIDLIGGAQACHVFWQVGSSATLGTNSDFVGNILALTSITATTGATVDGRLLALNGAVTLDSNTITASFCNTSSVPDTGSTLLLLGSGLATVFGFRRWSSSPA